MDGRTSRWTENEQMEGRTMHNQMDNDGQLGERIDGWIIDGLMNGRNL